MPVARSQGCISDVSMRTVASNVGLARMSRHNNPKAFLSRHFHWFRWWSTHVLEKASAILGPLYGVFFKFSESSSLLPNPFSPKSREEPRRAPRYVRICEPSGQSFDDEIRIAMYIVGPESRKNTKRAWDFLFSSTLPSRHAHLVADVTRAV